jgi:predicted DNA-binding protein
MTNNIGIMVWLPNDVAEKLKNEAKNSGLSTSSYVRSLIIRHLREGENVQKSV